MSGDQLGCFVHRPCVRRQWLARDGIIQMLSKCQRRVVISLIGVNHKD